MKSSAKKLDSLDDLEIAHKIYGLIFLLVIPAMISLYCCNIKKISELVLAWKDKKYIKKSKRNRNLSKILQIMPGY